MTLGNVQAALNFKADVRLQGPDDGSVSHITFGFMQHGWIVRDSVAIAGRRIQASYVRDIAPTPASKYGLVDPITDPRTPSQPPWYYSPSNVKGRSDTIQSRDNVQQFFPVAIRTQAGGVVATATDFSFFAAFHLDVAAQTDEDTASFWQEADAVWNANYSGSIRAAGANISWESQPGVKVIDKPGRWGPGELPIPLYVSPPPSLEALTAFASTFLPKRTWATV